VHRPRYCLQEKLKAPKATTVATAASARNRAGDIGGRPGGGRAGDNTGGAVVAVTGLAHISRVDQSVDMLPMWTHFEEGLQIPEGNGANTGENNSLQDRIGDTARVSVTIQMGEAGFPSSFSMGSSALAPATAPSAVEFPKVTIPRGGAALPSAFPVRSSALALSADEFPFSAGEFCFSAPTTAVASDRKMIKLAREHKAGEPMGLLIYILI